MRGAVEYVGVFPRPPLAPTRSCRLRVGINNDSRQSGCMRCRAQVYGERGLSSSAFLANDCDG